ncbi:hydroxymethylglutaryl-CoA reductase, degradative [Helcococcus kunzii]|uniref:hydroxymethylglutaryl-CoA reductase, degradative n=1 Tax=Helcococcus kunzii TaxID=40091 RepID=UPI0024AE81C8|nr:hydroxymethylglutaryl-CoA reductase, degradative [Helcococcus kunzii]
MNNDFYKFYNKTINERIDILKNNNFINDTNEINLDKKIANNMIENYVLNYQLPLGLAMNFIIDDERYIVPMAIEEPSVIAAASNGAKIVGNIKTKIERKYGIGQIVLTNLPDINNAFNGLMNNKDLILEKSKEVCQSMIKRGGGPKEIWIKKFENEDFLTLYISIDTCDAMGANTINTVLEHISKYVEEIANAKSILNIISNYNSKSIVKAQVNIPLDKLSNKKSEAIEIAKKIELATKYANLDIYRCATHNKGIMNGIDAVAMATGNDWRAVESSAHSYASKDGKYRALTTWLYDSEKEVLNGEIEIPMPVATVGGTISVHPIAKWALSVLKNPDAKRLACIIAAVGLVQNFSALKALVTDGIQKGHMSLHAKTIAIQAGAKSDEINPVVMELAKLKKYSITDAKEILHKIRGEK